MENQKSIRIDRWLWAARLFRSRSMATAACQSGKVKLNRRSVKPGRAIIPGDHIQITRDSYKQQILVRQILARRISAAIAAEAYEDQTPPEELEQLKLRRETERSFHRIHGDSGRPTKRERREINKFHERF